ncbi:MAG: aminotransferase class IV [Sulfurospirillum sp.]
MKKFISPCLETMLYENDKIQNLDYHQKRFDETRRVLFGDSSNISLDRYIIPPKNRRLKIRVIYNKTILKVEYQNIQIKDFRHFVLVQSSMVYDFKYEKRDEINLLKKSFCKYDDIILCDKGMLKDTSIANIAVKLNNAWYTPEKPLLRGTARERLLDKGFLKKADLDINDLKKSSNFAIMNALIGFKEVNKGVFDVASSFE